MSGNEPTKDQVRGLMQTLYDGQDHDPAGFDVSESFIDQLEAELIAWADANGEAGNPRLNPVAA